MRYPAALFRAVGRVGRFIFAVGLCAAAPAVSLAGTTSTSFSVTADVVASCAVQATNLDFGDYSAANASPDNATSTIQATCSPGSSFSIALDAGQATGATVAARSMTDGSYTLPYTLYTTSSDSVIWGDGTLMTSTVSDTGTGSQQSYTVYGQILAGQYVTPGNYSDTINVTLTY